MFRVQRNVVPRAALGVCPRNISTTTFSDSKQRVVIIGGVAGGATAAARITRLSADADVTILERGVDVSFANCGLPYYIGRSIPVRSALLMHTPKSLEDILRVTRVLTRTEATMIDRNRRVVFAKNLETGAILEHPYDKVILSPGASPIVPDSLPGVRDPRVVTLRDLKDMDKIDALSHRKETNNCCGGSVAVVGAGFIGLEIAEQLAKIGQKVTLLDLNKTVLPQADPEMSVALHEPLRQHGIELVLGESVKGFDVSSKEAVKVTTHSGMELCVDYVVFCIGVKPESSLAKQCGLNVDPSSPRQPIVVNDFMQTSDPDIYAVGDAVITRDMVFPDRKAWVALGNVANMQARVAADHAILGKSIPYPGSNGSSIVRVFDKVLALTGWTEKRLNAEGIPYRTTTINALHHAGYYPGAEPITMKITFCPETGRIFGAQAVGTKGVDKRIDVIATAIQGKLTVEDLSLTQLTYSPPFGSARDVVNVAALSARNIQEGLVVPTYTAEKQSGGDQREGESPILLDNRQANNAKEGPIKDCTISIPDNQVQALAASKIPDKSKEYVTICDWGKTAYFANRQLMQKGYKVKSLVGGWRVEKQRQAAAASSSSNPSKL